MTYRIGIAPGLAALVGASSGEPRIVCDGDGCSEVRTVRGKHGQAPRWFLAGRAAPGWTMERLPNGGRRDLCPRCSAGQLPLI